MDLNGKIFHFTLDNGLKVILFEDHSSPEVYGAVHVNAGSKNDPEDATGMAHYFEHIMFKGTDRIGTVDWEKEKVYLDAIAEHYDKLYQLQDHTARKKILKQINELSQKAAEYAIPNETDVILKGMGGQGLNAYTSYDQTVYLNSFPSNQLEKWMDVYMERFRNPVFRLFQSELETVYEEKNMHADNPTSGMMERFFKEFFGEHPYGRPIIGYTEHLKNPRISKMMEFYATYYVANNMTLILVGDFLAEEIKPWIIEKFGLWKKRNLPEAKTYEPKKLSGRTEVKVKMSPVKMGILAFPGPTIRDQDNYKMDICVKLLSNQAGTGLMDKSITDGLVLAAGAQSFAMKERGMLFSLFVPKFIGQSLSAAEDIVWQSINALKQGNFSEDLFNAIKMEVYTDRLHALETTKNKFDLLLQLISREQSWEDYIQECEAIERLTKEDLMAVADKYFTNNYLAFISGMGKPENQKIDKPDWEPVTPHNLGKKSTFAVAIDQKAVDDIQPQHLLVAKDVEVIPLHPGYTLYANANPVNELFELSFRFKYGESLDECIKDAAMYMSLIGANGKTGHAFQVELQKIGAQINFSSEAYFTNITLNGFEKDLPLILNYTKDLLLNPTHDEKQIKLLVENIKANDKFFQTDSGTVGHALFEYALYGEQSVYVKATTAKQAEKYKGKTLFNLFKKAIAHDGYITFNGCTPYKEVCRLLQETFPFAETPEKGSLSAPLRKNYRESTVLLHHDKKAVQSNVYFYLSEIHSGIQEQVVAKGFDHYFGGGMSSLVFQEIREFRSLAYSAFAQSKFAPYDNNAPGFLQGFLSTQSDKTPEAIRAMLSLITDMPLYPEKYQEAKNAILIGEASKYINFRKQADQMAKWQLQGFDGDPRKDQFTQWKSLSFEDIQAYYQREIKGKPLLITLSGNLNTFPLKELKNIGVVKKVKTKNLFH